MATLAQFSQNIRKVGSRIENGSTVLVKKVAKKALRTLVRSTPVDTGEARSNWRVGIGAPTRSVIEPYAPGKKLGIGETANAAAAIAAGVARINSLPKGPLKTSVYISNNTRHINLLNEGRSNQAPAGFVDAALAEAEREIKNFRFLTGNPWDEGEEE